MDLTLTACQIWLIIALIAFIIEIFSNTFVFLCFCLGCLCSSLAACFTDSITIQLVVFAISTIISFFTVRPLMNKYAFKRSDHTKINIDALYHAEGYVTETIDNTLHTGRVMVYGDDWKAVADPDEIIEKGTNITVVKIDSNILIVKPVK